MNRCSRKAVHNYLVDKYGIASVGTYSTFKHYVKTNKLLSNPLSKSGGFTAYECNEGDMAQCDWKENIKIHDRSGKEYTINVFHLVLKFSRYSYIEMTLSKEQPIVFRCLINAFNYFGGVPKSVLFDNMSTVVDTNVRPARINAKMLQFAKDFNFEVKKCKPRSPQTKGTNEARNKMIDRIKPYDNEFDNIGDLLTIVDNLNFKMNNTICNGTGISPEILFYKEKERLNPLPKNDFESYYCNATIMVTNQQMIYYKGKKYSVDKSYIGKRLRIEEFSNMLLIYYKSKLIEIHQLSEAPINYKDDHYDQTSINTVNQGDFKDVAKNNLLIMEKIAQKRVVTVSLDKAIESNHSLHVFLLQQLKNQTYFVEFMASKSIKKRNEFLSELREIVENVTDIISFLNRFDQTLKKNCDNVFVQLYMEYSEGILSDLLNATGYTNLFNKHKNEINNYLTEIEKQDAHTK